MNSFSDAYILGVGIGLLIVTAAVTWYSLSQAAIAWRKKRLGLPTGNAVDWPDLTDEQAEAMWRFLDQQRTLGWLVALPGIAGFLLINYVWSDFAWVVIAACFGYIAWVLNEVRLGNRRWHGLRR